MKTTPPLIALAFAAATLLPGTAKGAIVINIEQQGSDVVASYSGSIDLTGIGFNILGSANSNRMVASGPQISFQNGAANKGSLTVFGKNPWSVAPSAFGTGGSFDADSATIATGNAFGFQLQGFFIEPAYVSGSPISGSMTFENQTLASMGIDVGTMNATFSSGDTMSVVVSGSGPAPVPEPGTWAAAALLVGGAAFARWRRRQAAVCCKASGELA